MIDEPSLLAAILADPDNDRLRLAYADWLEEQDQRDRGRLIRVQIELAHKPDNANDTHVLRAEEEQLEALCENALPRLDGITWGGFERGLVRTVYAATAAAFYRHASVVGDIGSVDRVKFDSFDGFDMLSRVPALARFTELNVYDDPHWGLRVGDREHRFNDDLQAVLASPHCPRLRSLQLNTCQLGPRGAKALADCPQLTSLVHLCLLDNYIGDEGMAALAASPYMAALRIDLNNIGPAGIEALAASVSLGGLEELFLGEDWPHPIGPATGLTLGRSPYLTHLRELSLHDDIGALGVEGLAQGLNLASLTYLDIRCDIGPDGARALAASRYLRQMKSLRLYGCWIGDEGAKALARSPLLATLEEMDLTYNNLTDVGAQALANSPYLERLNPGGLAIESGNHLTANGMRALQERFSDKFSAGPSIAATEIPGDGQD
ncbi:MAG: TIGR02996 domain-containing protein [Planctomycetota bacterium]|nr:TIGR02996 domain-containing protein [Planctomycetota bacterium]